MQGGHHGHADFLEQGQDVAPGRSAVDAEFMLDAQHVRVVEVEEVRRPAIGMQVFLVQFEAHPRRILVGVDAIVHGAGEALGTPEPPPATASQRSCVNVAMPQSRGG